MSMSHRSRLGSPSAIHSAITFPIPPAPARPWAQNPHATKNPSTSVSPRQNSLSGVNPSGPLISLVTLISSIAGTRRRELLTISSNRSHSSSSVRPLKSGGISSSPSTPFGEERGRALVLVPAHHQAAGVLAEVDQQVRVAQRRQALSRRGHETAASPDTRATSGSRARGHPPCDRSRRRTSRPR